MSQFRAIVHGRVQGVCFRAETVAAARKLGLQGHARNLTDGTVEVLAQGSQDALQSLVNYLKHGPSLAAVSHIDLDWNDRSVTGEDFRIVY